MLVRATGIRKVCGPESLGWCRELLTLADRQDPREFALLRSLVDLLYVENWYRFEI